MTQTTATPAMNSRDWWEDYFASDWDANHGSQQTRHFMERLVHNLPVAVLAHLATRPLDILDWGCAFGQGVEILARSFPRSKVTGLDFAERAIEEARQRYPKQEFLHTPGGEIPRKFDVVVCSNCLEHFDRPLDKLKLLLGAAKSLCFVLVPYNEHPLCKYHPAQFREESFPEQMGQYERLCARPIEIDPQFWPGRQLLVVYASRTYLLQQPPNSVSDSERDKWDSYYATLPLYDETPAMDAFHTELASLLGDLVDPAGSILEAGCGGGLQSVALAKTQRFRVALMDLSQEALNHARRRFERAALEADFRFGNVFEPGEPEFDLVFNAGVLEHYTLEQQAAFLRGMASRSRNYVLVLVPNRLCYWYWLWRIRAAAQGNWPFGKEAPLVDLSSAFEAAGMRFLGQTFLADAWTEDFIQSMTGMDEGLRQDLVTIHRSPLLEKAQKGYLLAALGTVSSNGVKVPAVWTPPPLREAVQSAEVFAALADTLALRIAAEPQLTQLQASLESQRVAAAQALAAQQFAETRLQAMQKLLDATGQQLQQIAEDKVQVEQRFYRLQSGLLELGASAPAKRADGSAASPLEAEAVQASLDRANSIRQEMQELRAMRLRLESITSGTGWALLQVLYRIRFALLPRGSLREHVVRNGLNGLRRIRRSRAYQTVRGGLRRVYRRFRPLPAHQRPAELPPPQRENAHVVARVQASKGAIIFLPSVPWTIHLFQRPHHLARYFARQGYVTIFDCSGTNEVLDGFREIEPNLFLFKGPQQWLHAIPNAVLWAFTYNYYQTDTYPAGATIMYDWIDDLTVFPYDQKVLLASHQRALREATYVASVARRLHEEAVKVRADALYLPNGVEDARFADESVAPATDPQIQRFIDEKKPIAGYYGALASWFDYRLLEAVAKRRPDWNFLLIGPMYDESLRGDPLLDCPNVAWIGPRDYHVLPGYLKRFDVAMIPFVINDITLATSPLKLYEYFSGGKPVITSPMPECMAYPEVHIVRTVDEFSAALDTALAESRSDDCRRRLRALGAENSWAVRVEAFLATTEKLGRIRHYRTGKNHRLYNALVNFYKRWIDDPCLPMWFDFAISTNDRGRSVVRTIRQHINLEGKRCLDVGCAFGGFLVAFAEQGADVTGFDIDPNLLGMARQNLEDNGLDVPTLKLDATAPADIESFRDSFDVITCNDVIEHVKDPAATICNIASMLKPNGLVYFEMPNKYYPRFVLKDGHHLLFGITLLENEDASAYYDCHAPGMGYTVGHYLEYERYIELMRQVGITASLLEECFTFTTLEGILADLAELETTYEKCLETVPASMRGLVREKVERYLAEARAAPLWSAADRRAFMVKYGMGFWRILGKKTGAAVETEGKPVVLPRAA